MKTFSIVLSLLFISQIAISQDFTVPDERDVKLKKAEDYKEWEDEIIACVDWLEQTRLDLHEEKRQDASKFLLTWLTGAPNVTMTLYEFCLDFANKNPDMLIIYMGAYTKYTLQNPEDAKDEINPHFAAVKSVITFYNKNRDAGLKKEKSIEKIKDKSDEELKDWLKGKLK